MPLLTINNGENEETCFLEMQKYKRGCGPRLKQITCTVSLKLRGHCGRWERSYVRAGDRVKGYKMLFSRKLKLLQSLTHSIRLCLYQSFNEVGGTHRALSFTHINCWLLVILGREGIIIFSCVSSAQSTRIQCITLNPWTHRWPRLNLLEHKTRWVWERLVREERYSTEMVRRWEVRVISIQRIQL